MNTEVQKRGVSPRDVFLHILAMIGLYVSAISFGNLIFELINIYLPDPLNYYPVATYDSIRWSVAVLIIIFPVYVYLTKYLYDDLVRNPEKRELKIRKWLIYLTLTLAASVIIGDLITLVYYLLKGDIALRFILKVITVLFIAASIFIYYRWELKMQREIM